MLVDQKLLKTCEFSANFASGVLISGRTTGQSLTGALRGTQTVLALMIVIR
jgi:hypothetical protein